MARGWEKSILSFLKKKNADLATTEIAGKFDGYTEAWRSQSYPIGSLKEIMELVRSDEI